MYFESRVIEYARTFRYTWRVPLRIRANSDPNTELFAQCDRAERGLLKVIFTTNSGQTFPNVMRPKERNVRDFYSVLKFK